ncbi:hypothetical protein [Rhodococcoides fascians]|uniref:hypothetical protein n=1 Tax=Rhodococcoides fascians TaxID=1828 RepID=UPI00050C229F|nr:hypothetical protein [Rhodococcus fascians]
MAELVYPGLGEPVTVPDDSVELWLAQGWKNATKVGDPVVPGPVKPILKPPPKSGPGSGVKAWQQYALDLGVATGEDSEVTRDEFIERIAEAGFPVE